MPKPKKVTFVSNYFNTRVGMYYDGVLQYEEHYNLGRTHFLTDKLFGKDVPNSDKFNFRHAANLLTLTRTPFDWREAEIGWLAKRKFFPKELSQVKFA